jgi:hypothetical protein
LSEPETSFLASRLLEFKYSGARLIAAINYYSVTGTNEVQPGYRVENGSRVSDNVDSASVAREFANRIGYRYSTNWQNSGEMINWCGENDIRCFDAGTPRKNLSDADLNTHLNAILDLFDN